MSFSSLITFAGGIGLFLLGMRLMSDGLKVAAGSALRGLLARATGSPLRALASGVLITALVQSSSAVIFATIGFVNAGLLTLGQAVGVIFGANLGTTLTSWIVALVGFDVDLRVLAMPAVALGMGLWIAGRGRGTALGQALVGFGIFFLGLDVLKGAFSAVGPDDLFGLAGHGGERAMPVVAFTAIGIMLTLLMQSSSAALALTLTAAATGMLPPLAAAAMVVGANVGTTSTAVFASIGATAPAQRAAAAHVVFNLVAAGAALALLPWMLGASAFLTAAIGLEQQVATTLAVFHTLSKLLGVALVWPFTGALVAMLERRFGSREADPAVPHFLDRAVAATPRLAVDALAMELTRIGAIAQAAARTALAGTGDDDAALLREQGIVDRLGEAAIDFAATVNSGGDPVVEAALPDAVRVAQYYRSMAERAVELGRLAPMAAPPAELAPSLHALDAAALAALADADPAAGPRDANHLDLSIDAFEAAYQHAKSELLRAGSRGTLPSTALVRALDRISILRRIIEQAGKGALFIAHLMPPPASAAAAPGPRPDVPVP
ncbi:Na/Pi cotransporter family protein [Luteimonas sp. SJ-92]|uniref:Na/Pi cotransporter family protein n=1 Tax=Luteimonas salinisoli TaxID=2752307 RepID=A0A853JBG3_9GAMM|nr:Na/Pi symporter [Luteimonas salinisoli]NZA26586.1 Na/Pi cotransporter family protein [Luteimonas salinisoli]